jgi:hypothetical protein
VRVGMPQQRHCHGAAPLPPHSAQSIRPPCDSPSAGRPPGPGPPLGAAARTTASARWASPCSGAAERCVRGQAKTASLSTWQPSPEDPKCAATASSRAPSQPPALHRAHLAISATALCPHRPPLRSHASYTSSTLRRLPKQQSMSALRWRSHGSMWNWRARAGRRRRRRHVLSQHLASQLQARAQPVASTRGSQLAGSPPAGPLAEPRAARTTTAALPVRRRRWRRALGQRSRRAAVGEAGGGGQ